MKEGVKVFVSLRAKEPIPAALWREPDLKDSSVERPFHFNGPLDAFPMSHGRNFD
jgi:hypothetical protein